MKRTYDNTRHTKVLEQLAEMSLSDLADVITDIGSLIERHASGQVVDASDEEMVEPLKHLAKRCDELAAEITDIAEAIEG